MPFSETRASIVHDFQQDRRGWLICIAVLVVTIVRSGITYSFGVFVVALVSKYHTPLTEQNWIGTLSFTISLCCAPLSVTLIRYLDEQRYRVPAVLGVLILTFSLLSSSFAQSAETLFFTHSLLYGIGSSLLYMSSSLIIGEYFDEGHKHHVLATSILLCGYPLGSLIFNPINSYIVENNNWRDAFRICAAIVFVFGMICSLPMKRKDNYIRRKDEELPTANSLIPKIPRDVIKSRPEIMLWFLASTFTYLGFYMPFVNLEYYMSLKHISQHESGWALFLLSLAECISYISASLLGGRLRGGRLIYVNVIAAVSLAIVCVIWPSVDRDYYSIMAIGAAMGFFLGLTIVYTYAESGEITMLPLDIAWAYTNMFSGLGILLGPLTSGVVFELRNSYDDVFYTVAAVYTVLALLLVLIVVIRKLYRTEEAAIYDAEQYSDIMCTSDAEYQQAFRITKPHVSDVDINGDVKRAGKFDNQPKQENFAHFDGFTREPSFEQNYDQPEPTYYQSGQPVVAAVVQDYVQPAAASTGYNQADENVPYSSNAYDQGVPIRLEQLPESLRARNNVK